MKFSENLVSLHQRMKWQRRRYRTPLSKRTTCNALFSLGSSVEKANDLSFTILCAVTMTPEKYRYERAAAVGKNVNLKERTGRGIGTWESEKPVLCNKSPALTFKK